MDEQNNRVQRNFDLSNFKLASERMIATNISAYNGYENSLRARYLVDKSYTPEEIASIIDSGSLVEQQSLSRNYFHKDGYYKQIILYYATLLKYVGLLIPNPSFNKKLSTSHIQKRYFSAMDMIEVMQLQTWCTGCAQRALIDGSYYGVLAETSRNEFSVLDLPAEYCCSRFKDQSGNDLIEFDLSYFNTIRDKESRQAVLAAYPKIIAKAYKDFSSGKRTNKWFIIPSNIGICFPFFDGRPLFLSVIPKTIEYDEALGIEKERNEEEIKKIIVNTIPHLSDGRLLFEPDEAEVIHQGIVGMMKGNKNVRVLTSYGDVSAIASNATSNKTNDSLKQMEQNIYAQAGVSGQVFASSGSATLNQALNNDLALMMYFANKVSIFITNFINNRFGNTNVSFKYEILPISYYNTDEYIDSAFKLVGSGYSFLMPALAMGLSQRDLGNVKDLENDVLKLGEKLKPLQTSYTQSGEGQTDEGGRPEEKEENKAEKTIQNEESKNKAGGGS